LSALNLNKSEVKAVRLIRKANSIRQGAGSESSIQEKSRGSGRQNQRGRKGNYIINNPAML